MKRHPDYSLVNIEGHYILMPVGQAIETLSKDVEVNEVGAFIWNQMKEDTTVEEIARACMKEYECGESEYPEIRKVVESFIDSMNHADLLDSRQGGGQQEKKYEYKFDIAEIEIDVLTNKKIKIPNLDKFASKSVNRKDVQKVYVVESNDEIPFECEKILAKTEKNLFNPEMSVDECAFGYRVYFTSFINVKELLISKDGRTVTINCNKLTSEETKEELYYALRISFLYYAQILGYIGIHSSSVLYENKAWLFSAGSGTGKSTHANYWNRLFGSEILNGDMNLFKEKDSLILVYGTPWCGTSQICTNKVYPLGGVAFLKRSDINRVNSLSSVKKVTKLMHRLFSFRWTEEQNNLNLGAVQRLVEKVDVCELECTNSPQAAKVMKEHFDAIMRS